MRILAIHNAQQALPDFSFPGIGDYADRSLTNRGISVVFAGACPDQLRFYHSIGIGSRVVIQVRHRGSDDDLYQGILNDSEACQRIQRAVMDNEYKIQFFNTRAGVEEDFIARLGLQWNEHVISPASSLADFGNNKAVVRSLSEFSGLFPEHQIVNGSLPSQAALTGLCSRSSHGMVIKKPMWASGQGMHFVNSLSEVQTMLAQRLPGEELIVEQSIGPHVPMSIVRRYIGGVLVDTWCTEQICVLAGGTVDFLGNILAKDFPHVTKADCEVMQRMTKKLTDCLLAKTERFSGLIGWDCARACDSNQIYILEANIRETFSSYIRYIQLQLRSQTGKELACVAQRMDTPASIESFVQLQTKLNGLMFQGTRGIIPLVTRCLAHGYCYLLAVSEQVSDALAYIAYAKQRLES
jgi:hypothetical protein